MNESLDLIGENQSVTPQQVARLLEHFNRWGVTMLPKSVVEPMRVAAIDTPGVAAETAASPTSPPRTSKDLTAAISRSVAGSAPSTRGTDAKPPQPAAARSILVSLDGSYDGPPLPIQDRTTRLRSMADEVSQCMRCDLLCRNRKQTVFGEGNPAARVCFFGEAPGEEEDATGRPFVGRSGVLLTKMIEACTLSREQVYILNTVKCRPPGNRNPEPEEIANCREYFEEQLRLVRPQYIVCLGLVAVQTLLKTTQSIGKLRSRFHTYHDSKVLATYHPSYLLRYPEVKREAWADLKLLMNDMGIDVQAGAKKDR